MIHTRWKFLVALSVMLMSFLSVSVAWANATIHPRLLLKHLRQVSSQESQDEIYFLVSDLGAKSHAFYTVPGYKNYIHRSRLPQPSAADFPHPNQFWKGDGLELLKNIVLWERPLTKNTGTQLTISLIELDTPPWDLDDTLGTVKVNLFNDHGHLKQELIDYSHASIIHYKSLASGQQYVIRITNDKAMYEATLMLMKS